MCHLTFSLNTNHGGRIRNGGVSRAFLEQGFTFVRKSFSRGYLVARRSADEIKSTQRLMAACDGGEKNTDTDKYTDF
ncbi:MAG: hypothetical protein IJV17_05245 [Prevotella sp.]|nr:hypothetical protein [Prevotella sp.]